MKKVNLFFLVIFFALTLNLIILPFSAIAGAERADEKSLEKVVREVAEKRCKGKINEGELAKFINYIKSNQEGTFCFDCKKGVVVQGRRWRCNVKVTKEGPNFYTVR